MKKPRKSIQYFRHVALSAVALVLLGACDDKSPGLDSGKPLADMVLADVAQDKGTPSGTEWVFTTGGPGNVHQPRVATDKEGNVYACGSLIGPNKIGSKTVGASGEQWSLFVLKLNSKGKLVWLTPIWATDWVFCKGVAVDDLGRAYITGYIQGSASFGSYTLKSSGWATRETDIYVAKLDAKGAFLWARQAGSATDDDSVQGIGLDKAGNAYITGHFGNTFTFGSTTLTGTPKASTGFSAKLDGDGNNFLWAIRCAGPIWDIAVDSNGASHIVGSFDGPDTCGKHSLAGSDDTTFVAKVSSAGQVLWATETPGLSVGSISLDGAGNTYLRKAVKLAKLDKGGKLLWTRKICDVSGITAVGSDVVVDDAGNAYLSGSYEKLTQAHPQGQGRLGHHGLQRLLGLRQGSGRG